MNKYFFIVLTVLFLLAVIVYFLVVENMGPLLRGGSIVYDGVINSTSVLVVAPRETFLKLFGVFS